MYGEGAYAMTVVKEVEVTEQYLGLPRDKIKCQNIERLEECTTREYLQNVQNQCNCVPFGLNGLVVHEQVKI